MIIPGEHHAKLCPECHQAIGELVLRGGVMMLLLGHGVTDHYRGWCDWCGAFVEWTSPDDRQTEPERQAASRQERRERKVQRGKAGTSILTTVPNRATLVAAE